MSHPSSRIVTESNWHQFATTKNSLRGKYSGSRGYRPRDYSVDPYGEGYAAPYDDQTLIPKDEWIDRIREREENESATWQLMEHYGLKPYYQARTSHCWAHGVTFAQQLRELYQGQELTLLSATSVAAPIKNYRNAGGWGYQALRYLTEVGACEQKYWPQNSISRSHDTPESRENRKRHQADDWWDLRPGNFAQTITSLLRGNPVPAAYNWQRHLVCLVDAVEHNGQVAVLAANSGLGRDRNGWTIYTGSRAIPDEQLSISVATAT